MQEPERHVLVVDDDPVLVRLLELNFRLEGYRVSTASRGDEAVERAVVEHPHAIVLDVSMPGIDGYEACRRLRDDHGMQVPVVLLSAHAQDDDRARGEALGVVAYVTKPFDPEALVATVRAALVTQEAR